MASAARTLGRAARLSTTTSILKTSTSRRLAATPRQILQQQARRGYANLTPKPATNNNSIVFIGVAAAILGGTGLYESRRRPTKAEAPPRQDNATQNQQRTTPDRRTKDDYQAVYDAIAERLIEKDDYDDGSYGPVVLRLGWHASGTYDAETGTGGSNGATMRFPAEGGHGANAGLKAARDFLEPVKQQFPWISYGDLWTLAAACAVQEMGGPVIPWRPGRQDRTAEWCTPDGRLPNGAKGPQHLRDIFGRMGFNDQEIVALSGAHAVGRCHTDRSGFDGPWTLSPTSLTNDFYKLLLDEKWHERDWNGPRQYQDDSTKTLMMLPSDMALVEDDGFKPYVLKYASDSDEFFGDFSKVLTKLFELGVPFASGEDERIEFRRTD